jgi:hypothetical protein
MKIKTDFVTNSSAYDSIEIIIDNPVLLEVLQKYKEMGLFFDYDFLRVGNYDYRYDYGVLPGINYLDNENTKTPAINFYAHNSIADFGEQEFLESNTKLLESLLEGLIIKVMDYINVDSSFEHFDVHIFDLLKIELLARKEEINQAYKKVAVWKMLHIMYQGEANWEFTYDPINGESYTYTEEGDIHADW